MIRHLQLQDIDWLGIKEKMAVGDTELDEQKRNDIWSQFDPNGNGLVSLAEADLAFRRMGGPLLPIYYSKKVQLLAFNKAKSSNPGQNELQDDFIERSEFKTFLFYCLKFFGYYFLFKNMDQDNDERLRVIDFITNIGLLRQWGADLKDNKDAKKWFYKYDENKGGVILMDEWVQFSEEMKLDIEKNSFIIEQIKKPRIIYKLHDYMKAGTKRPSKIDPNLWVSKSPAHQQKDLDKEINEIIMKNKLAIKNGEKFRERPVKEIHSPINKNFKQQQVQYYKNQEQEDDKNYEELENEVKDLDEENYLLKEQLKQLKKELQKQKKIANSQVIII